MSREVWPASTGNLERDVENYKRANPDKFIGALGGPKPEEGMEPVPVKATPKRLLSTLSSAERKQYPITTGCLDYFPDALAMVAHVSYLGNMKHNKTPELQWTRAKSSDHPDCEARHLIERGHKDPDGIRHSAEKAWRALADLQIELEKEFGLSPPRAAR